MAGTEEKASVYRNLIDYVKQIYATLQGGNHCAA